MHIEWQQDLFGKGSTCHIPLPAAVQVPIEFEFQIRELRSNPCFRVEPSKGVVPAHGHVVVEVTFSPAMLRTEEMVLEVGPEGGRQ
jgi:hypothetical protein